jgi:hypothetical protein
MEGYSDMKRIITALVLLLATSLIAHAANDTIGVTAGSGKTADLIKYGSNNVISEIGVCDPTTENQCQTTQSANSHVAADIVVNDASGNRLNGLTTGTLGSPSTQYLSVQNADPCSYAAKSSASIAITTATTTSLVAVSGSTAVYVCGFSITISQVVTTANTFQFEYGTGASCTGTHALSGTYGAGGVTAGIPIVVSSGGAGSTIFTAPASNGICAVTAIGASGSFEGVLTYVQQ